MLKILIVEARIYDALLEGAVEVLKSEDVEYDVIPLMEY